MLVHFNATSVPSYKPRPGFVPMCKATARKKVDTLDGFQAHLAALASSVAEEPVHPLHPTSTTHSPFLVDGWTEIFLAGLGLEYYADYSGYPRRIHTPSTPAAAPSQRLPSLPYCGHSAYASAAAGEHRRMPTVALLHPSSHSSTSISPAYRRKYVIPAPHLTTPPMFSPLPFRRRPHIRSSPFDLRPSAAHYTQAIASPKHFTPRPTAAPVQGGMNIRARSAATRADRPPAHPCRVVKNEKVYQSHSLPHNANTTRPPPHPPLALTSMEYTTPPCSGFGRCGLRPRRTIGTASNELADDAAKAATLLPPRLTHHMQA
ncbi:hypothetical protein B0H14DRAFT_3481171 [Mycena olivaceomarginata]|nr:hypothetical protein B0H14DRAFT_3481171 [Mycena olivaceomarginata]